MLVTIKWSSPHKQQKNPKCSAWKGCNLINDRLIPGVTGKFGLGVQNEAGQRLTEFCQENPLVRANTFFQQQ